MKISSRVRLLFARYLFSMRSCRAARTRLTIYLLVFSAFAQWCNFSHAFPAGFGSQKNCADCHGPSAQTTPANGGQLNFGNVLVGQDKNAQLQVKNKGPIFGPKSSDGTKGARKQNFDQTGTFPASSGDFSLNGSSSFTNLRNATAVRSYTFSPTTRGTDSQSMRITITSKSQDIDYFGTRYKTAGVESSENPIADSTVTFTGRGVAPVSAIERANVDATNVRVGTSSTVRVGVKNTGDGNLSGSGTNSNLLGSLEAASGEFSGAGGSISLPDAGSTNFAYTFSPGNRGAKSINLKVDLSNGSPDGTNQAHTENVQLSGIGVGPVLSSSETPGSTIDFGEAKVGESLTKMLQLSNTTDDGDLGNLTDLTLLSSLITGPDAHFFAVSNFKPGTVLSTNDTGIFELKFLPTGLPRTGVSATLVFLTDEGAVLGANGNTISFPLAGNVSIPEPSTLALLGISVLAITMLPRRKH